MKELYYIKTDGYSGNAYFWWGKNSKGYVTDIREAGQYTAEEAKRITSNRKYDKAYPVSYIDNLKEAQKLIIDSQYVNPNNEVIFE